MITRAARPINPQYSGDRPSFFEFTANRGVVGVRPSGGVKGVSSQKPVILLMSMVNSYKYERRLNWTTNI